MRAAFPDGFDSVGAVKLDPKALEDAPERLRQAIAKSDKPEDWIVAIRGFSASDLKDAVAALRAAALDAPATKKTKDLVVRAPFFHHGDLEVDGNLRVVASFFVTGDVKVAGVMMDCGPDSNVAIGGDVHASHLHTSGEFGCGDIVAPGGVVYGHYNDNTLDCMAITARVVIADEHDIQPSKVKAEIDYSDLGEYEQGYGDGVGERLRAVFVDEVFESEPAEEGYEATLDHRVLFDRLWKGQPVFREKR